MADRVMLVVVWGVRQNWVSFAPQIDCPVFLRVILPKYSLLAKIIKGRWILTAVNRVICWAWLPFFGRSMICW